MFIDRTQVFLAAANPALYQASADALNELTREAYSRLGELGRRGFYAEAPLLTELNLAQAFVGIYDGSAGDGLVLAEHQHAQARQLPCFIYTSSSLTNAPAGNRFSTTQELTRLSRQDLRNWLFGEHLPVLFGKIEREEISREDALLLISAVKDSSGVSSEWRARLAEQGYHFAAKSKDSWLNRVLSPGLRAFARMFLIVVAPLLLLLLAYQQMSSPGNQVAINNEPTPEATAATPPLLALPTPVATTSLPVSTATPFIAKATPYPEPANTPLIKLPSPVKATPYPKPANTPMIKPPSPAKGTPPTISATPKPAIPVPTIAATPTPAPVVRLQISPRDLRFAQSGTQTITFRNAQFPQVEVRDVSFSQNTGEFTLQHDCRNRVLQLGQSCQARITFQPPPTNKGAQSRAAVVITYGDNQRQTIGSTASTPPPPSSGSVSLSPSSLSFRAVKQTDYVTVQNTGTVTIVIAKLGIKSRRVLGMFGGDDDAFRTDSGCVNRRLEAGNSCRIGVSFTPRSKGEKNADLEISIRGEGGNSSKLLRRVPLQGNVR